MNKYLARAWVEISLGLMDYRMRADLTATPGRNSAESSLYVHGQTLGEVLDGYLNITRIPEREFSIIRTLTSVPRPYSYNDESALHILGVSRFDTPFTIEMAYDLQISDDLANCPIYLGALTHLSHVLVPGHEALQIKVATEKSLDRYTIGASERRDVC